MKVFSGGGLYRTDLDKTQKVLDLPDEFSLYQMMVHTGTQMYSMQYEDSKLAEEMQEETASKLHDALVTVQEKSTDERMKSLARIISKK